MEILNTFTLLVISTIQFPRWHHPQNAFWSLWVCRSMCEDVECKYRSVSFRRISHCRSAFQRVFGVTLISDDLYRCNLKVILIGMGTFQSAGDKIVSTWEGHLTNAGIQTELWEMPGFRSIFIWRTAGIIRDSLDLNKNWITLHSEYDAWIIIDYHF